MTLTEKIKADTKAAMIAKDELKTTVLRGVSAAILNEALAKKKDALDDADVIAILKRLVKQRKDSIEQFTKGGRPELAEAEAKEIPILSTYLPETMSRDDIKKAAAPIVEKMGTDKSKMGQIIGAVSKELKGKAEGADIKAVVEEFLK